MNNRFKYLYLKSLMNVYLYVIVEDTDELGRKSKWFKNSYKLHKKIMRNREKISNQELQLLESKINEVRKLEDEFFGDGEWNPYSLVLCCLEYLVMELDVIELKRMYLDFEVSNAQVELETNPKFKDLNNRTNRYFSKILELIGE